MADPDTFADLDALAAKGDGVLIPLANAPRWTYRGAPRDPASTHLRLPVESVVASRVQAALATGAWVPAILDDTKVPPLALAVVKALPGGALAKVIRVQDVGTAAAA